MRKALALLLLLAVPASAQPRNPDTFVYAITGDVDSLDPHWAFDGVSQEVEIHLYDMLIFFDGASTDKFQPMISTMIPSHDNGLLSDDGLRYAFPIRKGVKFHDGTTLTPEDVKYSLMRAMLLDRANGPSYLLLEPILGVHSTLGDDGKPDPGIFDRADEAITIEPGSVVIHLQQPYAPFLSILASYSPIVSKKWVIAHGGWDGRKETWAAFRDPARERSPLFAQENGTGPFMLELWDHDQKTISLARFAEYWNGPAKLARLEFRTVDDPSARAMMLESGEADAVMAERQSLPDLAALKDVSVVDDLPLLETNDFFAFNFAVDPDSNPYVGSGKLDGAGIPPDFFSDSDLRHAFGYAFDYDAFVRQGYAGKADIARGPIPKGVFGYSLRQVGYYHDPQKAEAHFRRAWQGQVWENGFRFALTYMKGRSDRKLACELLKKNVEELNPKFKIDVVGLESSEWLDAFTRRKIPMSNTRWHLDYPDAYNAVFPLLDSQGYYAKLQGYSNPRVDRLVEQSRGEPDPDKRRAILEDLQELAFSDAPQIYTVDTYHFQVMRSWVKDWAYNPILPYGYLYGVSKEAP